MRRWPWIVLVLVILAAPLAACNVVEIERGGTPTPLPQIARATPTPTPMPAASTTAAHIRANGAVQVGIRYDLWPFGFVTDDGDLAGFGVDMGREFARRWLGDARMVEFVQVRSDTAIDHLRAKDVDLVIGALVHSQDREAGVDFGLPYFEEGHALLVQEADAAQITGLEGLQGRVVGVDLWSDADDTMQSIVPFTLTVQSYQRLDEAVGALGRDEIDALAGLRHRLFWCSQMLPGTRIVGQFTSAPIAFVYRENDPSFADLVNLTYQEMLDDGTYADIYGRWFGDDEPPAVERWVGGETLAFADAPQLAQPPDTIGAIERRGRLLVAAVPARSPFLYSDEAGAYVGYEADLVRLLAERWLGDPTAVEFMPTSLASGQEMLQTGRADLLVGGVVHSRAAERAVDFGLTTYVAGESLMVVAGTPITDLQDLRGRQVAVVQGTPSEAALKAAAEPAGVSLRVRPQPTLQSAMTLLQEGGVVAVVGDRGDLLGPAYATPGVGVLPLRITQVPMGIAIPPGDSAFRDLLNLTLLTMQAEGQFTSLYQVWFDDAPPALPSWPGAPYRSLRLQPVAPAPAEEPVD